MAYFPNFVGSEEIRKQLGMTVRGRRLSHAYLLEGPSGSGKRTFARMLAAAASCTGAESEDLPCGKCRSCSKILSENAPDVHYLDRGEAATIGVDAIRALREEMMLSTSESDIRAFIIDDADTMTAAAQNALLIALEEPPENTLLLLLCESAARLLTTIRSRAQLLRMGYVLPEEIKRYLLDRVPEARKLAASEPERFSAVIAAADGRIGEAMRLLLPKSSAELLKQREMISSLADALVESRNYSSVYAAVMRLPSKRPELSLFFPMLLSALRDLILLRREPSAPLLFYTDREAAAALARRAELARLIRIFDAVREAEGSILSNANIPLTLTALAASIYYGTPSPS